MKNGNPKQNPFNPFLNKLKDIPSNQKPPSLDELDPVICPKCGNSIFDRYFKMFKMSPLKTASGKEQLFNVPVYVCASCAEILDMTNVDNNTAELKEEPKEKKESEDKTENPIDKEK